MSIIEETVVDYNLYFRVIFREFLQTYEGTTNTMASITIEALALGLSGNVKGEIMRFSLTRGRILHRKLQDVTLYKMHKVP